MKRVTFLFLSVLTMSVCFFLACGGAAAEAIFRITVIDVGKGDCILVQTGDAADPVTVMIDTGYKKTAEDVLEYLSGHGIAKLDALIVSHFHKDHVGGAAKI